MCLVSSFSEQITVYIFFLHIAMCQFLFRSNNNLLAMVVVYVVFHSIYLSCQGVLHICAHHIGKTAKNAHALVFHLSVSN